MQLQPKEFLALACGDTSSNVMIDSTVQAAFSLMIFVKFENTVEQIFTWIDCFRMNKLSTCSFTLEIQMQDSKCAMCARLLQRQRDGDV